MCPVIPVFQFPFHCNIRGVVIDYYHYVHENVYLIGGKDSGGNVTSGGP